MYAPVRHFIAAADAGAMVGYAAPASGRLPAAVELWSGELKIATAAATRYSDQAATEHLRAGWCGFSLNGIGEAFALNDQVTLRCAASAVVLLEPSLDDLAAQADRKGPRLLIEEMLGWARRVDCANEPAEILPFALSFSRRVSLGEFVERTATMMFRRFIDFGSAKLIGGLTGEESPEIILEQLASSDEFLADPLACLPGPFHPDFAYGLEALG